MFQDANVEAVILVSPKFGISQINSLRTTVVCLHSYLCLIFLKKLMNNARLFQYLPVSENHPSYQTVQPKQRFFDILVGFGFFSINFNMLYFKSSWCRNRCTIYNRGHCASLAVLAQRGLKLISTGSNSLQKSKLFI